MLRSGIERHTARLLPALQQGRHLLHAQQREIQAGITTEIGHLGQGVVAPIDVALDPLGQLLGHRIHQLHRIGFSGEAGHPMTGKQGIVLVHHLYNQLPNARVEPAQFGLDGVLVSSRRWLRQADTKRSIGSPRSPLSSGAGRRREAPWG